jgi:hypothetical protein
MRSPSGSNLSGTSNDCRNADAGMTVVVGGMTASVTLVTVLTATVLPLALAGAVTWLLARRSRKVRTVLAWAGLAVAIATRPVPVLFAPQPATGWTLATMHLIAGLVWLGSMTIGTRRRV